MAASGGRTASIRLVHVVYAVLIYCALVAAAWPRRTYDTWWHLATGRLIVQEGRIPHTDPFTYTREGEPWIAHEWLWEVLMYALYARWEFTGLIALTAAAGAVLGALLAWLCLRRGSQPLVAVGVGALGILAARALFNVRPQLASLLLLTVVLVLIQLARDGRPRWLWLAPVVMLVWVNVHGGFIFGPALLGLYALCLLPQWLAQRKSGAPMQPAPAVVTGSLLLMAAASLANPNGLAGALYPLEYLTGDNAYHKDVITEYSSPDFSAPMFAFLAPYVLVLAGSLALSGARLGLFDLATTVVFLFLALRFERNVALFVFMTAPVAAASLSRFTRAWRPLAQRSGTDDSPLVYGLVIAGLAVSAAMALHAAPGRVDEVFSEDYPTRAVEVIREAGLRGNMFNTYHWGGYLIWQLWPEHKVFIDGRADVMGRELMMDWIRCHRLEPGWREVLERHRVQWLVISVESPLCRALPLTGDFELIHSDENAEVFVRRNGPIAPTGGGSGS